MDHQEKGFWDWLLGRETDKGPKVPDPSEMAGGHRGIAAGDLRPGRQDLSAENVAQWEQLTGDEVERFVVGGERMNVHSTNVQFFQYNLKKQELTVGFKAKGRHPASVYVYSDITPQLAIRAAQAQSKGGYVIDTLVGRGNVGKRGVGLKPFRKIS
jgi:hypothetical protein